MVDRRRCPRGTGSRAEAAARSHSAPRGGRGRVTGVAISRFARGRLVDVWLQADLLGFLQQLAVLPPLDLTQAMTMAQVLHAGALLADGLDPGLRSAVE